jgi:hypothetical protein
MHYHERGSRNERDGLPIAVLSSNPNIDEGSYSCGDHLRHASQVYFIQLEPGSRLEIRRILRSAFVTLRNRDCALSDKSSPTPSQT